MRLRVRTDLWATSLFATLGLLPMAACGGKSAGEDSNSGAGGSGAGASGTGASTARGGSAPTGSGGTAGLTSGGSSSGGSVVTMGGTSAINPFPCDDPMPLTNPSTGYLRCANGVVVRSQQLDCPSTLPRSQPVLNGDPMYDQCTYDADCVERPYGHCDLAAPDGGLSFAVCQYGCTADADCGANAICQCGEAIGTCVQASCASDADCLPGFHCANYDASPGCYQEAFACQEPGDTCAADADCGGQTCTVAYASTPRICQSATCIIGRPFLVDEVARVAPVVQRDDWLAGEPAPDLDQLSPGLRQRLAEEWTRSAQLEHASVAAFSRFLLELLAFGAPAELVAETISALEDERRHAEICFALASRYAGEPLGPGALDVDGALEAPSLARSLATAVREGCIGETIAALEAAELAVRVLDPVLQGVLERIAADERRHSELAWKFVQWAVGEQPALADVLERELSLVREKIEAYAPLTTGPRAHELSRAGVMPEVLREAVRNEGLRKIVEPGLAGLVEHARRRDLGAA